eukprot:7120502-Alexandrium_andersonii.AAC.1
MLRARRRRPRKHLRRPPSRPPPVRRALRLQPLAARQASRVRPRPGSRSWRRSTGIGRHSVGAA